MTTLKSFHAMRSPGDFRIERESVANSYDEKGLQEVLKRGQEALDRVRKARSIEERSHELWLGSQNSLSEDVRRQHAERFALNQKIRADVHDLFMKIVGGGLEKKPDSAAPVPTGAPAIEARIDGRSAKVALLIPQFPKRASWLKDRLLERGWSNADPSKYRGPDRKTIEKLLRSEGVRNDVLEKLAEALSSKGGKVSVLDVPNT